MNLAVSDNLRAIDPASLPRDRAAGEPPRVLFLCSQTHGFKTLASELVGATEQDDRVRAVHVALRPSPLVRAFGRAIPGLAGRDRRLERNRFAWRTVIAKWMRGPLRGAFDWVHVVTGNYALALTRDPNAPPYSVSIDATDASNGRLFGADLPPGRFSDPVEHSIYERAALVCPMSDWAGRSLVEDHGVDPGRVQLTPPAVDLTFPTHADLRSARNDDAAGELPTILLVGKPWRRKGADLLLKWHQERWAQRARLVIVCADAPQLSGLVNAEVHAAVPRERLRGEVMPAADLFVLPTRLDQSPWVLAEAAAAGLPCVTTDMAALPELVLNDRSGIVCPRGDEPAFIAAVESLLDNPARRSEMGLAARRHAEAFLDRRNVYRAVIDRIVAATTDNR